MITANTKNYSCPVCKHIYNQEMILEHLYSAHEQVFLVSDLPADINSFNNRFATIGYVIEEYIK